MFFLRSTPRPLEITYGDRVLQIPMFTVADTIEWGKQIQADRDEKATEGMEEDKRREYLNFYPSFPPTIDELRKMLRTSEGIDRVVTTCFNKAGLGGELTAIMKANGMGRLEDLAKVLSDFHDPLISNPGPNPTNPTNAEVSTTSVKPE